MTIEELSVAFTADISPFAAAAEKVSALLTQMSREGDLLADAFYRAGISAGAGLENGIAAGRTGVIAAARSVAQAAAEALRGALAVHSPSRLTFEVGSFFGEGLRLGILESAGRVEQEAAALGDRSVQALKTVALPDLPAASSLSAAQPLSITIPLEVDGYRLGVAALEGLNRVQQAAGRIELAF